MPPKARTPVKSGPPPIGQRPKERERRLKALEERVAARREAKQQEARNVGPNVINGLVRARNRARRTMANGMLMHLSRSAIREGYTKNRLKQMFSSEDAPFTPTTVRLDHSTPEEKKRFSKTKEPFYHPSRSWESVTPQQHAATLGRMDELEHARREREHAKQVRSRELSRHMIPDLANIVQEYVGDTKPRMGIVRSTHTYLPHSHYGNFATQSYAGRKGRLESDYQ